MFAMGAEENEIQHCLHTRGIHMIRQVQVFVQHIFLDISSRIFLDKNLTNWIQFSEFVTIA
jgi:hypothetical protein